MGDLTLYGSRGAYVVDEDRPFAWGRTSHFYKGTDPDGQAICVKLFRELEQMPTDVSKLDEFVREIRARQRLQHDHILPLIDHGIVEAHPPRPFIVMPLCDMDLRRVEKERDYMPLAEALTVLRPIAAAVDYAHGQGIIHGDIKPENILFADRMAKVFVTDFGMSRYFVQRARVSAAVHLDSHGGGTPDYLSPEELDEGSQSYRSDIYSLAVLSYELITGRIPFDVDAPPFKQMKAKVEGKFLPASQANARVSDTVSNALAAGLRVEPADRPRSATALCDMLEGVTPVPPASPPRRKSGRAVRGAWSELPPTAKVAIITAVIAAAGGVVTALIKILPDLLK